MAPKDPHAADRALAQGFRPRVRPWANAAFLNGLLALLLIGAPWYRGRMRAQASVRAFADYAACLHGGEVTHPDTAGLAMPEGHRERYAALYQHAVPQWPASCREALDRVSPPEATFLLPGAKEGEAEVRAAVITARSALDALIEARASDSRPQTPERPLATLAHVAAAVTILIEGTGISVEPTHQAFDLGEGDSLVAPSRVPLRTARGGPLLVTGHEAGVRAIAADSRGVMHVRAERGDVHLVQVRRPSSARAVIDDGTNAYLGWVTSDATCAQDELHCARRLLGLARVREEAPSPTADVWVAAHPALPLARSIAIRDNVVAVVARAIDQSLVLRVVDLPAEWPAPHPPPEIGETPPAPEPLPLRRGVPLPGATDVVLHHGGGAWRAIWTAPEGTFAVGVLEGEPVRIGDGGEDTILACGDRVLAVGSSEVRVMTLPPLSSAADLEGGQGELPPAPIPAAVEALAHFDAAPQVPVHAPDPLDDTARCAASEAGVSFAWVDAHGALRLIADVDHPRVTSISDHVAGFALARSGETVLVASWGDDGHRQVTLRRIWRGRELASDVVATCWEDGLGFCGSAGFAQRRDASGDDETVVFAREQSDLLVMRITGSGVAALPGLGDR